MAMVEIDEEELDGLRDQAAQVIPWKNSALRFAENLRRIDPGSPLLQDDIVQSLLEEVDETRKKFDPRHDAEGTKALARASEGKDTRMNETPLSPPVKPIGADS